LFNQAVAIVMRNWQLRLVLLGLFLLALWVLSRPRRG
jgi:hypothetical protein